jgi:hypothetical protein
MAGSAEPRVRDLEQTHLLIDTATMAVEPIVDRIVASVAAARTKMPSSSSR